MWLPLSVSEAIIWIFFEVGSVIRDVMVFNCTSLLRRSALGRCWLRPLKCLATREEFSLFFVVGD